MFEKALGDFGKVKTTLSYLQCILLIVILWRVSSEEAKSVLDIGISVRRRRKHWTFAQLRGWNVLNYVSVFVVWIDPRNAVIKVKFYIF